MKRAVLFDLDGVLLDSMAYHVKAWQEVFLQFDVEIEPNEVYKREGTRTAELAGNLAETANLSLSSEQLQELTKEKSQKYDQITQAVIFPGAEDLIEKLTQKRIFLAIVTGTFLENITKVMPMELFRKFDVVITGGDVDKGKPDPEPYLKAAQRLGLPPSDCIVIENAVLGVESGKAAGMYCVGITSTQSEDQLKGADRIVADLNTLLVQIDSILNED